VVLSLPKDTADQGWSALPVVMGRDVIAITSVGLRRLEGRAGCPVVRTPIAERTRRSRAPTFGAYFAIAVLIDFTTASPRTLMPSSV